MKKASPTACLALNGMKILKTKKLEKNVTDIQLEMRMTRCLLKSDQQEYFRDWAKERGTSILSSTFLEAEDEDAPLDFDKTISDEIDYGTMEVKREFLNRFLVRKQVDLSEILSSRRTRSYARNEVGNNPKFVKFKEKTYQITEYDGAESLSHKMLQGSYKWESLFL